MVSTSPVFYDSSQPLPLFFTKSVLKDGVMPETTVASDVWIGQGVMIKAGISVGVGAVIGAGAIVVKNVEAYSIVGGCPAKHLKWRFPKLIRESLEQSLWWEASDKELEIMGKHFNDVDSFILKYGRGS